MQRGSMRQGRVLAGLVAVIAMLAAAVVWPAVAQVQSNLFASPESRLALVISQRDYTGELSRVDLADREATSIAHALIATGFDVSQVGNLTREDLNRTLDNFRIRLERAGPSAVGFVYYTGHGVQHPQSGDSYMLGIDARLQTASDLARYGLNMESQRDAFAATGAKAVFLVFDACRNVPSMPGFKANIKGLNRVEASADMLIAFSTGINSVAEEGIYAPILAGEIAKPGQSAEAAFAATQRRVADKTGRKQLPWTNNLLYNEVCFAGCSGGDNQRPVVSLADSSPPSASNAPLAAAPHAGESFRDCSDCPQMVSIPAGSFLMGSPASEAGRYDWEGPQRRVSVPLFAAGKYEVTWTEYGACVSAGACEAAKDDGFGKGTRPVTNVSWDDAKKYVAWLSSRTGKTYRLLSEAEWEYAARAGTTSAYPWGSDPNGGCGYANGADMAAKREDSSWTTSTCNDGVGKRTAQVGSYRANAFGLHDMHGNVWEWVEDCYAENYSAGQPSDGRAFTQGNCSYRVIRGGSWINDPQNLRSANRGRNVPTVRNNYLGFRVARTL